MTTPKRPTVQGWTQTDVVIHPLLASHYTEVWCHDHGLKVLSSIDPSGKGGMPEWHVSAVFHTDVLTFRTPTKKEVKKVRRDFGMEAATMQQKPSDVARHLWLACS